MTDLFLDQFLIPFLVRFFFVAGLFGLAVGVILMVAPQRMDRLSAVMNRWVSVRGSLKWLEEPHDVDAPLNRFFRWAALPIVMLVLYSTFVLSTQVNAQTAASALGLDRAVDPAIASILVDTLRWFLVVGGGFVVVVAIGVVFFPGALSQLEKRANRWLTTGHWLKGLDLMHFGVEAWLRRHPRATGLAIAVGALVVTLNFGVMLLAPR